jgi:predicted Zn-dependent peptidase
MVLTTLSHAIADICVTLKKERKIEPFDQHDLRRTAETMLQKLGVGKELRAHLLSHGRHQGVQGKSYERYAYLPEKRRALRKWAAHLERIINARPVEKVTPIRRAA